MNDIIVFSTGYNVWISVYRKGGEGIWGESMWLRLWLV